MKIKSIVILGAIVFFSTSINAQSVWINGHNHCEEKWHLVFEDEFNGSSLNSNNWVTFYPYSTDVNTCQNCRFNDQIHFHSDNNFEVNGGICKIIPKLESGNWLGKNYNSSTGVLYSIQKYKYGKFEIRCKWPSNITCLTAFWSFVADGGPYEEIDVYERLCYVHSLTNFQSNYHWGTGSQNEDPQCHTSNADYSSAFHTFAIEWDSFKIKYYIDNVLKRTIHGIYTSGGSETDGCNFISGYYNLANHFPRNRHHIIASLGSSGEVFDLNPNLGSKDFEIEYIRVYQRQMEAGLADLCPENYLNGDNILCWGDTKTYTLGLTMDADMVWIVPNVIEIVDSSPGQISIRLINQNYSGWVEIEARPSSESRCFDHNATKKIWVGKSPTPNFSFSHNCQTKCFQFTPIIDPLNTGYFYGYVNYGSGSIYNGFVGCTNKDNYTLNYSFNNGNYCGSNYISGTKTIRCKYGRFAISPNPASNSLAWKIEDESNINLISDDINIIYISKVDDNYIYNVDFNNYLFNSDYTINISNYLSGNYVITAIYNDDTIISESFIVSH